MKGEIPPLPNLVGCGAGKSGTTSLYYYLSAHPAVFMAMAKEIHYFSRYYDRGEEWYRKQFSGVKGESVVGEFSTSYMLDEAVPVRMHRLLPEARLLFVFRDPAERAYSNYWSRVNLGLQDPGKTFSEVIRSKEGENHYLKAGYYFQHLSRFLRYYELDQMQILFTEELNRDPSGQMARCWRFLGVDPALELDYEQRFNITVVGSSHWRLSLDQGWLHLKSSLKPLFLWLPSSLRRRFSELEQKARRGLNPEQRPPMEETDYQYLAERYQQANQSLARLLARDLPWRMETEL